MWLKWQRAGLLCRCTKGNAIKQAAGCMQLVSSSQQCVHTCSNV
jgi:hypothetical protein